MGKTMTIYLAILALLSAVAFAEDCSQFDQFVIDYNKTYKDEAEKQYRREVFCENMAKLEEARKESPDATFGINKFSDRTEAEMKSNGFEELSETSRRQQSPPVSRKVGNPSSLDWRDSNVVTSVKDQGQCGSCWAFAAAACFESREINKGEQTLDFDVSEQYFLECTRSSSCNGGYMEYVMQLATNGVKLDSQYPYNPYSSTNGICDDTDKTSGAQSNKDYYQLDDNQIINLLQEDPVAIALCAQNWSPYTGGILSCSSACSVDHAVLLIGYGTENGVDFWIIKNSWGAGWGENGYIKVRRGNNDCKIGRAVHILWNSHVGFGLLVALTILGMLLI